VLGGIGLSIMSVWKIVPQPVDAAPAFRIAAGEFASKPTSGHVVTSSRFGRALQYSQLNNRNTDLAVALIMPPKGFGMGTQLIQDLADVNLLRLKHPMMMTQTHHDLDTRFGEFRATEMRSTPMAAGSNASPIAAASRPHRSISPAGIATAPATGRAPMRWHAFSTSS